MRFPHIILNINYFHINTSDKYLDENHAILRLLSLARMQMTSLLQVCVFFQNKFVHSDLKHLIWTQASMHPIHTYYCTVANSTCVSCGWRMYSFADDRRDPGVAVTLTAPEPFTPNHCFNLSNLLSSFSNCFPAIDEIHNLLQCWYTPADRTNPDIRQLRTSEPTSWHRTKFQLNPISNRWRNYAM